MYEIKHRYSSLFELNVTCIHVQPSKKTPQPCVRIPYVNVGLNRHNQLPKPIMWGVMLLKYRNEGKDCDVAEAKGCI